jgi:rhodanese-related sulfurtransferase
MPPSISPTELRARLGRPDAPLLLDVRRRPRFAESEWLIPGAQYCAPEDVEAFARSQAPREVVAYCVYGHNVSHDAAAALAAAGWNARYLAGGIEGGEPGVDAPDEIALWRGEPVPRVRKRPDLGVTGEKPSRWITRERPKIDRIACPWLVRRFIDPRAEFHYVPAAHVFEQARQLGAVPYDIEGAAISHRWERCSFDALIEDFGLSDPALHELATIVRGADTSRPALAPQCAGLLAVSLGLSRMHAENDHAMLAAGMVVYDALYAWCRDARAEKHTWVAHAAAEGAAQ